MKAISILTVDDSPSMRALLKNALVGEGYDVAQAEDGVDAVDWLKENEAPELVITDINMPRMDGYGLIEHIRASGEYDEMPILVLSTESSAEKKARAREAGATGWIVKPFDPQKLAVAVQRVTN